MPWEQSYNRPLCAFNDELGLKLYGYGSQYAGESMIYAREKNPELLDSFTWSLEGSGVFLPFILDEYQPEQYQFTGKTGKTYYKKYLRISLLGMNDFMLRRILGDSFHFVGSERVCVKDALTDDQKKFFTVTSNNFRFMEYFNLVCTVYLEYDRIAHCDDHGIEKIIYICPETKKEFTYFNPNYHI